VSELRDNNELAWAARMDFWQSFLANPFGLLLFFGTVALIPAAF